MIADYEAKENKETLVAPRMYGLSQTHKHLPEIVKICGLEKAPVFCPVVSSFYSGMQVIIPIGRQDVSTGIEEIKDIYREYYKSGLVGFSDDIENNGFISANALSGFDNMQIGVFGNDERITLVSLFDNLGKGACGAAIQNMNISLGLDQKTGLIISED